MREREELFWKNLYDMDYLRFSEPEAFTADLDALRKEFDEREGKLREIQGIYQTAQAEVEKWSVSKEKKDEEIKKIIAKKDEQMKPLAEIVQPLFVILRRFEHVRGLMDKCKEKDEEMRSYIKLLKWQLKTGLFNKEVLPPDDLSDKDFI